MQLITTHRSTDFDAFASLVAATLLYPGAVPMIPKTINPNVKAFLSIHKDLFEMQRIEDIDLSCVDSLVVVDTNRWERLEPMEVLQNRQDLDVRVWDHHTEECDLRPKWMLQESTGANITLMMREIKKRGIRLSPIQATLFLLGLYEDTGSLSFPSTTAEDAYTGGYLLEKNADLTVLNNFLQPGYGVQQKDILFEMLKSSPRSRVGSFSVSVNTVRIQGHVSNLSLVVHMYREIMSVDAAFGIFVHENHDKCIVIGRSAVEEINIGAIMRSMGGGGHPGAGSAMLKSVNPEALEEWIHELLKGNQQASVQVGDLMSNPVITVASGTSMEEVAAILKEEGCTGVPVVDAGRLVGIISRRDFRKVKGAGRMKNPVKAFMSTKNITIGPENSLMEAARLMVKHDIGRLPVIQDNQVVGIISRSDAMLYFYDLFPH
ncbi:MAG TPA: CBS domain-containing protein [Desulfosalsimonadaceae bacterium]|nr:CBS domain-containing protein [Desulfosalsimonadaceae bacterium]